MTSLLRKTAFAAIWLAALAGLSGTAFAHARLSGSSPVDGASLQASPSTLSLSFSEGLEPDFSHLTLTTKDGRAIELTRERVDGAGGNELSASPAMPLPPGSYELHWQILSTDGHKTSGSVLFAVRP